MDSKKLNINGDVYNITVADTPETRAKGFQDKLDIGNDGILFVFNETELEEGVFMWMKDTPQSLDIIFIDDEWEVIDVIQGEPFSEELLSVDDTIYVLELKANSGIEPGDYIDLSPFVDEDDDEDDEEEKDDIEDKEVEPDKNTGIEVIINLNVDSNPNTNKAKVEDISEEIEEEVEDGGEKLENIKMEVLDNKGKTQMKLDGGERIFSRKNTNTLIKMAKRAKNTKSDSHYRALGKKMFQYIKEQDGRKPEYVDLP